jgi:hypothetical protein
MPGGNAGGGLPDAGGFPIDIGMVRDEMLRQAALKRRLLQSQIEGAQFDLRERKDDARRRHAPTLGGRDPKAEWRQAQMDRQLAAETDAIAGTVPTKVVSPLGINPFSTEDPMAMTGAQRRAFLPGNATASVDTRDVQQAMFDAADDRYSNEARRRASGRGTSLS